MPRVPVLHCVERGLSDRTQRASPHVERDDIEYNEMAKHHTAWTRAATIALSRKATGPNHLAIAGDQIS
jgi:hypothetical protein